MNSVQWIFDVSVCAILLWLAWQALTSAGLFKAVVLFMVFGLVMAITWARLDAPDVALVEAAIGAGLTGALFLTTLARLSKPGQNGKTREHEVER